MGTSANGGQLSIVGTLQIGNEIPTGTIDGVNDTFILSNTPSPSDSLKLIKNGLLLRKNDDYTLSSNTITFVPGAIPDTGDNIFAFYTV